MILLMRHFWLDAFFACILNSGGGKQQVIIVKWRMPIGIENLNLKFKYDRNGEGNERRAK